MPHNMGMRAVIQRVDGASVSVDGEVVGEFTGFGLMVLIGVSVDDTPDKCAVLADKIWKMRIFEAPRLRERGIEIATESNEVAAADANLPILAISQFTLFADTSKGRRPTWNGAARGDMAEPMVDQVVAALRALGATVAQWTMNCITCPAFTDIRRQHTSLFRGRSRSVNAFMSCAYDPSHASEFSRCMFEFDNRVMELTAPHQHRP